MCLVGVSRSESRLRNREDHGAKVQCEHWEKDDEGGKRTGKWDSNNCRLLLSISVRDIPPDETHYFRCHLLILLMLRKRVRKRRTFARFPQSCMWHHWRLLFRLVSSNSQPHSSPPHSCRRDTSPLISNSAAECAIDQSIRSSADSLSTHSHVNLFTA
jgi:hypothetical protein